MKAKALDGCMFRARFEVTPVSGCGVTDIEDTYIVSSNWKQALKVAHGLEGATMRLCALEWMHGSVYKLKES